MAEVTVQQLAEEVGTPVDRLLEQLKEAGVKAKDATAKLSDDDKLVLLKYLRDGAAAAKADAGEAAPRKITLKRRSTSELKLGGGRGARNKTVSVEVRKKRVVVKPREVAAEEPEVEETPTEVPAPEAPVAETPAAEVETAPVAETPSAEDDKAEAVEPPAVEEEEAPESEPEEAPVATRTAPTVADKLAEQQARARAEMDSVRRRAVDNARRAAEKPAEPRREHDSKGGGRRSDRLGRKELHVSEGKSGRRKKKGRTARTVKVQTEHVFERPTAPVIHEVAIPEFITVGELAQRMAVKSPEVIKIMMGMGVMATINQSIDQDTAVLVVEEMGHKPKPVKASDVEQELLESAVVPENDAVALPRPPVVTIMGHVDHGKTTLLDYIRHSRVAEGEAGGITQHIGAYHVETENGIITFLDTPGHAAFTKMRARGAQITDVVILVVSADDGVMPQTQEAIEHAKAAGVPIVVAVTKCDKEDADPERVRNDLSKYEVIPEEWGGDTQFINVSGITGEGVDKLLESVLLQAELMELKAPVEGAAMGVVIEGSLEKGRGPVATLLVQQGTLKKGDVLLAGEYVGRVRAMFDESGQQVQQVGPSFPAEVLGLPGTPDAGDEFHVLADDRKAREVAEFRAGRSRDAKLAEQQAARLEQAFARMSEGETKDIKIMVKADVQGSTEALRESLTKLSTDEIRVVIVSSNVGGISESDVDLALASQAIIIGFNVRADAKARKRIQESGVDLRYYSVIYEVIDDVKAAMSGLLGTEMREEIVGLAEVKDVFRSSKFGAVAGSLVVEGSIRRGLPIRVLRDSVVIYEGELESLRRHKDDVNKVEAGTECGIAVKDYNDVKPGDQIEVYDRTEVQRTVE